jgi:hypothetical protein
MTYFPAATAVLKNNGLFKEELMKHISPIGWEHMNFLAEYSFDINRTTKLGSLRPLNNRESRTIKPVEKNYFFLYKLLYIKYYSGHQVFKVLPK